MYRLEYVTEMIEALRVLPKIRPVSPNEAGDSSVLTTIGRQRKYRPDQDPPTEEVEPPPDDNEFGDTLRARYVVK